MSRLEGGDPQPSASLQDPPPFAEPWEAQLFALTVKLSADGVFTWGEWTKALSTVLKKAPQVQTRSFDPWLIALERLLVEKGVASKSNLQDAKARENARWLETPHDHARSTPTTLEG